MIEDNYIGIGRQEREDTIYRYTSVERLLEMIVHRHNKLTSPRKWNDPFENALAKAIRLKRPDGSSAPYPLRNRAYGQCWTLGSETDAFWRMYIPHGGGVRLRSTISRLYQSLRKSQKSYSSISCFIGRLDYKPEAEVLALFQDEKWIKARFLDRATRGHVDTLLVKRVEFSPEKEVRLLFLDPRNTDHGSFFSYQIDPSFLILGATLDPRMDDDLFDTYAILLREIGFVGEIDKSSLYRVPKIELSEQALSAERKKPHPLKSGYVKEKTSV